MSTAEAAATAAAAQFAPGIPVKVLSTRLSTYGAEAGGGVIVERFRAWAWWIWPIVPAIAVVVFLVTSGDTQRMCPAGPGTLSLPSPERCLPTLFASLTGADPVLVALSWLIVGAVAYLVVLTATFFVRTRGFR